MAKNKLKLLAPAISLLGASLLTPAVMATSTNYNMDYSGGTNLGTDNVTIDADLVDSLTPIIAMHGNTTLKYNGLLWQTAWQKIVGENTCRQIHYVMITQDDPIQESDEVGITITEGKYRNEISIKEASLYDYEGTDGYAYLFMVEGSEFISVTSGNLYSSEALCNDNNASADVVMPSNNGLSTTSNNKAFIKMHSELYKNDERWVAPGLFLKITDIDAAQSYQILNSENELKKDNMYATNAADLQYSEDNKEGDDSNPNLKNKYVSSNGHFYIYSQHDPSNADNKTILKTKRSDIYVGLSEKTVEDGLDVVYGFASKGAGSTLEYYALQHEVTYVADENGAIDGITSEVVADIDNPSGTSVAPEEGYELAYWTSNVDLHFADGTEIKAGGKITDEQLKTALIIKDTNFLAHFEKGVKVPDTGAVISDDNSGAKVITASVAGISIFAIATFILARFSHKKVDFKK